MPVWMRKVNSASGVATYALQPSSPKGSAVKYLVD